MRRNQDRRQRGELFHVPGLNQRDGCHGTGKREIISDGDGFLLLKIARVYIPLQISIVPLCSQFSITLFECVISSELLSGPVLLKHFCEHP